MKIGKRIKFVWKQYCDLIPAIWDSLRRGPYPPPNEEELAKLMSGELLGFKVDTEPTCFGVRPSDPEDPDYRSNLKMHMGRVRDPVEVEIHGY